MTVRALCEVERLKLTPLVLADGEREIVSGYAGDLLSWVMGRAQADEAWITIMSNSNIVAVASLADVACVILAEGVQPDAGVAETAQARGVSILGSPLSTFALCAELGGLLNAL